jgi:hypothetical protein
VRFSYDLSPPSMSVTYGLLLLQNGTYYRSNPPDTPRDATPNAPVWKSLPPRTLTAADFTEVKNGGDSGLRPNFSCTGGPIQFGYVTGTSGGNHWSISLLDNWRVDIIKGECLCLKRIKETVTCGQGGSYVFTVQLQNLTGTTIPQVFVIPTLPAGVTVSQQMFPVSLALNASTTLTFTITGAPPGATVVLRFLPSGVESPCCPPEIRVAVPKQGQC